MFPAKNLPFFSLLSLETITIKGNNGTKWARNIPAKAKTQRNQRLAEKIPIFPPVAALKTASVAETIAVKQGLTTGSLGYM